jgi:hypothetical protein
VVWAKSSVGIAVVLCTTALGSSGGGEDDTRNLATRLAETVQRQGDSIDEVKSWRRYVLHNPRWKQDATMDVLVRVSGSGEERGPEIIAVNAEGLRYRILRHIIEGEMDASREKRGFVPFTARDYTMEPRGKKSLHGRTCEVFEVRPKTPSRFTIEGHTCVDVADAAIVHFEGRTSKSLSFWVGTPWVEQDFRKVGDFWLCSRNHSSAEVKILGPTSLTIEYRDYVVRPKSGPALMACSGKPCGSHCFD